MKRYPEFPEQEWLKNSVFALVSACLFFLSGAAPGAHVIVLITILAIVLSALQQTYLQPGFPAAVFACTVGMFLYELVVFAFCLLTNARDTSSLSCALSKPAFSASPAL